MKNTVLLIFLLFVAGACKKDRTCTCDITAVSSTTNGVPNAMNTSSRTRVTMYSNVTRDEAACVSGQKTTITFTNTNGPADVTVNVDEYKCNLN